VGEERKEGVMPGVGALRDFRALSLELRGIKSHAEGSCRARSTTVPRPLSATLKTFSNRNANPGLRVCGSARFPLAELAPSRPRTAIAHTRDTVDFGRIFQKI